LPSWVSLAAKQFLIFQTQPKQPEIISIDEDDEGDQLMDDEESYEDQPEFEDEDEAMDETDDQLNDLNGDAAENGSGVPVLEPNLKSVKGYRNRAQGSC
jgi:hypothetical protein